MEESGRPTIRVAVALILQAGQILVTRRPAGSHLEGLWEFPGGKLLPGESPDQAACREALEETGLVVDPDGEFFHCVFEYPERVVELHFIPCGVRSGTLNPSLQQARWVSLSELAALPMPEANGAVVAKLIRIYSL